MYIKLISKKTENNNNNKCKRKKNNVENKDYTPNSNYQQKTIYDDDDNNTNHRKADNLININKTINEDFQLIPNNSDNKTIYDSFGNLQETENIFPEKENINLKEVSSFLDFDHLINDVSPKKEENSIKIDDSLTNKPFDKKEINIKISQNTCGFNDQKNVSLLEKDGLSNTIKITKEVSSLDEEMFFDNNEKQKYLKEENSDLEKIQANNEIYSEENCNLDEIQDINDVCSKEDEEENRIMIEKNSHDLVFDDDNQSSFEIVNSHYHNNRYDLSRVSNDCINSTRLPLSNNYYAKFEQDDKKRLNEKLLEKKTLSNFTKKQNVMSYG